MLMPFPVKSECFMLRKLPMWGTGIRERPIDFEWPTQEMFDRMQAGVSLRAITFRSIRYQGYESCITGVQVHLSDGTSSPFFLNN